MKAIIRYMGGAVNAALVGVLASQVFEGGIMSPYLWGCVVIVALGNACQRIGTSANNVRNTETTTSQTTV